VGEEEEEEEEGKGETKWVGLAGEPAPMGAQREIRRRKKVREYSGFHIVRKASLQSVLLASLSSACK